MHRTISAAVVVAFGLAFAPVTIAAQFILRDDTDGWAWLEMVPDRDAVVQLVRGNPQSGEVERLDSELLAELRRVGVRRVWEISDFEATESSVVGECSAVDWSAPGSSGTHVGLHTEVSFWDHTRLAATEIYESLSYRSSADGEIPDRVVVQSCLTELSEVLFRLGYDTG